MTDTGISQLQARGPWGLAERNELIGQLEDMTRLLSDPQRTVVREKLAQATRGEAIHALRQQAHEDRASVKGFIATIDAALNSRRANTSKPYHLPSCQCEGEGWMPPPSQRDESPGPHPPIARCGQGPELTHAQWEQTGWAKAEQTQRHQGGGSTARLALDAAKVGKEIT